jgi:uncharacterized protein YyaL (SSP411 family)
MFNFILFLLTFFNLQLPEHWTTNFEKAKMEASSGNKLILLSFSGSDWCIPCIKMEETYFEQESFKDYAADHLVLVKADFPRLKKNQLDQNLTSQNEKLAERYNASGVFPLTLILSPEGKILYKLEGLPKGNVAAFIESLKNIKSL